MTTFAARDICCAVCSAALTIDVLTSTNAFGASDLDTRPPNDRRRTIGTWVHRCPQCGYCAPDLANAGPQTRAAIAEAGYVLQAGNESFPKKANEFLCSARISDRECRYDLAAWACIHAAWVCDDAGALVAARRCRTRALGFIDAAFSQGQAVCSGPDEVVALRVDLLRRCQRFDEALALIERRPGEGRTDVVGWILAFQRTLCEARDDGCHTFAEIRNASLNWIGRYERTRKAIAKGRDANREATAPRRFLESLSAWTASGPGDLLATSLDAHVRDAQIRDVVREHCRAYGWTEGVGTIALAVGLARIEPGLREIPAQRVLARWREACAEYESIVDWLAYCVRDSTADRWQFSPPLPGSRPPPRIHPLTSLTNPDGTREAYKVRRKPVDAVPAASPDVERTHSPRLLRDDANELRRSFERSFGFPMPEALVGGRSLFSVDGDRCLLLAEGTGKELYLINHDFDCFLADAPEGYLLTGFWGHGANSYAFHYVAKTASENIFLRLAYGGVYMNNDAAAARVRAYLPEFLRLRSAVSSAGARLVAMEAMGQGNYRVEFPDGSANSFDGSCLGRVDLGGVFDSIALPHSRGPSTEVRSAMQALREGAIACARRIYDEEMRRDDIPRVGMRAMGAAMRDIEAIAPRRSLVEFRRELILALAALAERYDDQDGQSAHARQCIQRLARDAHLVDPDA